MQARESSRRNRGSVGRILAAAAVIMVLGGSARPAAAQGILGWDWSWEPNNLGAELGTSVTYGDVNGDGFSDVVVGAPDYIVNVSMALGAVFVFHGSATGPSATPSRTLLGPTSWCRFGETLAVGDIDGDGYDDVCVGAPLFGTNASQAEEGRVSLYRGSASGLASSPSWTSEGGEAAHHFGASLAAGDFDGDGYGDLAIGAPQVTLDRTHEGRVIVYEGGPGGFSVWPTWVRLGGQSWAHYGAALANVGDVDANGIDDLAVGAPDYDFSASLPNDGAAWVYLGSTGGLAQTPTWFGHGESADAAYGKALAAAGDVNGDGYGDLVVGAPDHRNGETFEGKAYVYLGRSGGVMPGASFAKEGDEAGAHFGSAVACAGDLNADGLADVLVGAAHFDGGVADQGRMEAFFGTVGGVAPSPEVVLDGFLDGALLGSAVSSGGDLDGDGFSDLLVGAPGTNAGQAAEGRVYARFGRVLLPSQSPNAVFIDPVDLIGSSTGLGEEADHGDFNGDGYSDLVVAARSTWLPGVPIGGVRVFDGGPSGISPTWSWRQGNDTIEFGSASARFGVQTVTAGDVDGDGFEDLLTRSTQEYETHILHIFTGGSSGLGAVPVWADTVHYAETVGSAGDINGDGFADIVAGSIGESGDDGDPLWYGQARIWYGSETGLPSSPDAVLVFRDAAFPTSAHGASWGRVVGNAGDLDGDGYSDVFISHPNESAQTGRVYILQGSPLGADTSAVWVLDGPPHGVWFGQAAAAAGDVNGDGYGDFLAADVATAQLFLGGPDGPSTTSVWSRSLPAGTFHDVAGAGDVDGDGYGDLLLGTPNEDHPEGWEEAGRVDLFRGGPFGPEQSPAWTLFGLSEIHRQYLGTSVLSIGDANGDGWGDFAIGAPGQAESVPGEWWLEGAINVFYGNARTGATVGARIRQPEGGVMPPKLARSASESEIGFTATLRSPMGRADVGLEVEVKPIGAAWGTGQIHAFPTVDTGAPVAGFGCRRLLDEVLAGLSASTAYEVRYRTVSDARIAPTTPWRMLATNPRRDLVFRTEGEAPAGIDGQESAIVEPSLLSLEGPNPFRLGTTLRYAVPTDGPVRLEVFDVNGRRVKTLLDVWQTAGEGTIAWDGTAEHGRSAGSGVFFARLETSGTSQAIRLVRVH